MTSSIASSIDEFTTRSFDFVIVGGGVAGLTVASRLAENGMFTVGVIEAGLQVDAKDHDSFMIPAYYGKSLGGPYDWAYTTVPQKGCNGRTIGLSSGKVLGGTSLLNFMVWGRGSREDYDAWEALGNAGWGWDALLPFFKKSETVHPPSEELRRLFDISHDPKTFGDSGPIQASVSPGYPHTHLLWHKTLNNLGFETNHAPNSGCNVGASTATSSIDPQTGARSPATRYPLAFPNLCILTGAFVNEIILSQQDGAKDDPPVASGVRFTYQNKSYDVSAFREVILSAGAIRSPQILELSGIGNPEILNQAGIPLKVDSPMVGENLQDHPRVTLVVEIDPIIPQPRNDLADPAFAAAAHEQYAKERTGPLTNVPYTFCYLPFAKIMSNDFLDSLAEKVEVSDISPPEKKAVLSRRLTERAHLGQLEYLLDVGNKNPSHTAEIRKRYASLTQILEYPFSVGSSHICPRNEPTPAGDDAPIIDFAFYDGRHGEADLDAMSECLEFACKMMSSAPLAGVVKELAFPPPSTMHNKELRRKWIADHTMTTWHPMGTCAMGGKAGIRGGVVDERLRVYGVQRLRVVDASVMPLQISGHLQATVYAIGEKGASMILEDNGR